MKPLITNIDKHITDRQRPHEKIKIGPEQVVQYPEKPLPAVLTPVSGLTYDCQWFSAQRDARQITGTVSFGSGYTTMTYNHTASGTSINVAYNDSTQVWTDVTKSWTVDEWINHYLKVNGVYYLIVSNTATTVVIKVANGNHPVEDDYDIVPFKANQFSGAYLVPDNSSPTRRYRIESNTDTVITINVVSLYSGVVTVGDGSAPYNTFEDDTIIGYYSDDYWNDYTIRFTAGNNAGTVKKITDYVDASGTLIHENVTNSIDVGDAFDIVDDMRWVPTTTTFVINGYRCPLPEDFLNVTLAPVGSVFAKKVITGFGEIAEGQLPAYINAIYSIRLEASRNKTVVMSLDCQDSIRIMLMDIDTGSVYVVHDSQFKPNTRTSLGIPMVSGKSYRLDIAFYAENGGYGFRFGLDTPEPLGYFISAWDSALPSPPTWVSVSGGGESGDPAAEDSGIVLRWAPPEDMFAAPPPEGTE